MYPDIVIGNIAIPSWYAFLFLGVIISVGLAIYSRPKDLPFDRKEITVLAALLVVFGLVGARILFIILHKNILEEGVGVVISFQGGFAYFGALIASIITMWVYSSLRKKSFLSLADYSISFLMLSQVFVRIGCLFAGCCYGRPVDNPVFGIVFKSVDEELRYPTQVYEALLLVAIYLASRYLYRTKKNTAGYTFSAALAFYGAGRFFIEFLRTDSPIVFLNMTLAQITCLALALSASIAVFSLRK